jgi:hypothetical protein
MALECPVCHGDVGLNGWCSSCDKGNAAHEVDRPPGRPDRPATDGQTVLKPSPWDEPE